MTQLDRDVRPSEVHIIKRGNHVTYIANVGRKRLSFGGWSYPNRDAAREDLKDQDHAHPEQLHALGPVPVGYDEETWKPRFRQGGLGLYSGGLRSLNRDLDITIGDLEYPGSIF